MSHSTKANKNKLQIHPKVYLAQYLYNVHEPSDDVINDTPPELEAELLENSLNMRQNFRYTAQRLRRHYQ